MARHEAWAGATASEVKKVSQIFTNWNHMSSWLNQLQGLQRAVRQAGQGLRINSGCVRLGPLCGASRC